MVAIGVTTYANFMRNENQGEAEAPDLIWGNQDGMKKKEMRKKRDEDF